MKGYPMTKHFWPRFILGSLALLIAGSAAADYLINPGDLLLVSVWKEQDLSMEALVRPDGKFSFPLAGDIDAAGHSVEEVRQSLVKKIEGFIPDVVATVILFGAS